MIILTSPSNPLIKHFKKLRQSNRYCRDCGETIAEGAHLTKELLKRQNLIKHIVLREGADRNAEVAEILASFGETGKLICVPPKIFTDVCPVETSVGILCIIEVPQNDEVPADQDSVFLDGVQDPGNVGTIIRTAAASGVKALIASPESAWVWSPKALRAGMGSHFLLKICTGKTIEDAKRESRAEVLVADARGGRDVYAEEWGKRHTLWVFGNEGLGVSKESLEAADKILLIPIDRQVESLNVAVAAAVCLFEQRRRRLSAKKI